MTNLSPAADAVLDAYNSGFDRPVAVHHKPRIAAALRAAADQVVPAENPPADYSRYPLGCLKLTSVAQRAHSS
jgi:hypothetical protein